MNPLVVIGVIATAIVWKRKKRSSPRKKWSLWSRPSRVAGRVRPPQPVVVAATREPEIEVSVTQPTGETTGEAEIADMSKVETPKVEVVETPKVEVVETPKVEVVEA